MNIETRGNTWVAEADPEEKAALIAELPELLRPAGEVVGIGSLDWRIEVKIRLNEAVRFTLPRRIAGPGTGIWFNRDAGGITFDGSAAYYSPHFYPHPKEGDEIICLRVEFSLNGFWWAEDGPPPTLDHIRAYLHALAEAISVGWQVK